MRYVGKSRGGLSKAPTKEARRKQRVKRRERHIKFIDLCFERWQFVRFRKAEEGLQNEMEKSLLSELFSLALHYPWSVVVIIVHLYCFRTCPLLTQPPPPTF